MKDVAGRGLRGSLGPVAPEHPDDGHPVGVLDYGAHGRCQSGKGGKEAKRHGHVEEDHVPVRGQNIVVHKRKTRESRLEGCSPRGAGDRWLRGHLVAQKPLRHTRKQRKTVYIVACGLALVVGREGTGVTHHLLHHIPWGEEPIRLPGPERFQVHRVQSVRHTTLPEGEELAVHLQDMGVGGILEVKPSDVR